MNLKGFCGADPAVCNLGPQPTNPLGPCPPGSHSQPCAIGETLDTVSGCCYPGATPRQAATSPFGAKVAGALYRIGAAVGCKALCPALPFIAVGMVDWLGLPAEIVLGPLTVPVDEFLLLIGEEVKKEICSGC
jgi:hypothetical protein